MADENDHPGTSDLESWVNGSGRAAWFLRKSEILDWAAT